MSKSNAITGNYLFNRKTGRTFPYTEELAKRGDLIACLKPDGSDALVVSDDNNVSNLPTPKFLKSIASGRVFPYSPVLARNSNMIAFEPEEAQEEEQFGAPNESTEETQSLSSTDDDNEYWTPPEENQTPVVDKMEGSAIEGAIDKPESDPEENTEQVEIDLEAMDKKQIQAFLLETYGFKLSLRKFKTDPKARVEAERVIQTQDPL